jgi:hypothetical protein
MKKNSFFLNNNGVLTVITVVSVGEFRKLMVEGLLSKSENTDFIQDPDLRKVIMDKISELAGTQITGGFIVVVFGVGSSTEGSALKEKTSEIIMRLPKPRSPVYLIMDDRNIVCPRVSKVMLDRISKMNLKDNQIFNTVRNMIKETPNGDMYSYGFIDTIRKIEIQEVVYGADVAQAVEEIQAQSAFTDLMYIKANYFL